MRLKLVLLGICAVVLSAAVYAGLGPTAADASQLPSGTPAGLAFMGSIHTATCGSMSNLSVSVSDPFGYPMSSTVPLRFTTTVGLIVSSGGDSPVTASLIIPPETSGQALVTVTAGSLSSQVTVNVTCAYGDGTSATSAVPAYTPRAAGYTSAAPSYSAPAASYSAPSTPAYSAPAMSYSVPSAPVYSAPVMVGPSMGPAIGMMSGRYGY